jgi:hypothetical protein
VREDVSLVLKHGLKMMQVAMIFGLLSMVAIPVWAEERQGSSGRDVQFSIRGSK